MNSTRSHTLVRMVAALVVVLLLGALAGCGGAATPAAPTAAPAATAAPQPTQAPPPTEAPEEQPAEAPTEEPAEEPTEAPAESAEAPKGTLTIAAAENPEFLDPTMSLQIYNWSISFSMFDTLVKLDSNGEIVPSLAESWEVVSPTTWKFNLRKDVKFHDGTPFTSAAVKATLDHIVNEEVGSRQAPIWQLYDRTETPDEYTAIIHTKEPMGTMLSSLVLTTIIPEDPSMSLNEHPIGTGPFKFVEWVKDDHLTVDANPDYWGGAPKLERIVFRTIPELATRISALESGEVDIVDIVPPEEFERLEGAGINLINQETSYLRFIWLGNEGPLADPKVRQAIDLAIDRKAIIDELFSGVAYEVDGCVAPSVVGYCQMSPLRYDPNEARRLLEEAGYADGFEMELKTAEYLAKQKELAEVVAAYLGEIGIQVNIVIQDQAVWIEDLLALNWQAEQIGTSTLTGDADYTLRRLYHSSAKRVPYTNEVLDELLLKQVGELDPDARQEQFCQICQILWDDVPVVFLFGTIQTYGVNPRVQDFEARPSQFMFFHDVSVEE